MNKYETIVNYIKSEIESGSLSSQNRLPSIRELSEKLNCSKTTIIHAYSELERKEIIYAVPQSGYYINTEYVDAVKKSLVKNYSQSISVSAARSRDSSISNDKKIDLSWGAPNHSFITYDDFQSCLSQAVTTYKNDLLSYSDSFGFDPLRHTLSYYMKKNGLDTSFEKVCITSGSQQALHILSCMPFPNNSNTILLEQPTYNLYIKLLSLNNIKAVGIRRNINGIDFNELESIFKNEKIKLFYTVPRYSNPMGLSYNDKEKIQLVELAEKYNVYIVEDDYLSDFETDAHNAPIYSMAPSRVIYIKSFSKLFIPGIRIASVLIPEELTQTFYDYKSAWDLSSSVPPQGALDIFIKNGIYDIQINKLKNYYKEKMNILNSVLSSMLPAEVQYSAPENGLFSYFALPDGFKADNLIHSVNNRNVLIRNAKMFYLPGNTCENQVRLSLCRADNMQIEKGAVILCEEISKLISSGKIIKKQLIEL